MSWFQVAQGIYYALSGAHILSSWGDEFDYAQRQSPNALPLRGRVAMTAAGISNTGFLGFQAGLHLDQRVDETHWATRVPFECHFRRKRQDWPDGRPPGVPAEVEWFLMLRWYHQEDPPSPGSLRPWTKFQEDSIRFVGKDDFTEVTVEAMQDQNTSGGAFVSLSDTSDQASSINVAAAPEHPKFFRVVHPPSSVGPLSPLRLSWSAEIVPGPNLTKRELAKWFNPKDPKSVSFRVVQESISAYQEIDYDFFV